MNELHFKVKDIEDGATLNNEVVCMAEDINLEVEDVNFTCPIYISVKLFREGMKFYVTADIKNEAEVECSRCLEMFIIELDSHFEVQYYPTSDRKKSDRLDESAETKYYGEEQIDISDDVVGAIVAEIPFWARCFDDCKGLCHKCGHNLNLGACDCSRLGNETSPFAALANLLSRKQVVGE